jgi:hypothetical protein
MPGRLGKLIFVCVRAFNAADGLFPEWSIFTSIDPTFGINATTRLICCSADDESDSIDFLLRFGGIAPTVLVSRYFE